MISVPIGARIWFEMPVGLEYEVWKARAAIYASCTGWRRDPRAINAQANTIGWASRGE
jgi:hypothetical protein